MSFYYSTATGFCIPVNPQCRTWNNQGHCLSCYVGYAVSGTQCIVGTANIFNLDRNIRQIESFNPVRQPLIIQTLSSGSTASSDLSANSPIVSLTVS